MGGPDLLDEAIDVGAPDPVVGEHSREDLDRRLEFLRDDVVRPEANELGDLDYIARARDDVDTRIEPARDPHHTPGRRGVRSIPRARRISSRVASP